MSLDAVQDLDKSGNGFQQTRVYLGPTLGWVMTQVKPSQLIDAAGTYDLGSGAGIVFVDIAGSVTINLPDASKWVLQGANPTPYLPASAFERAIWIKDLGYHAQANPITVSPFGSQTIDGLAGTDFTIGQDGQLVRLYPLNDLSGWFAG